MSTEHRHAYNLTIEFHGDYLRSYRVSEFICRDKITINAQKPGDYWIEQLYESTGPLGQSTDRVIDLGSQLLSIPGVCRVVLHDHTIDIEISHDVDWSFINSLVLQAINNTFSWGVGIIKRQEVNNIPRLELAISP